MQSILNAFRLRDGNMGVSTHLAQITQCDKSMARHQKASQSHLNTELKLSVGCVDGDATPILDLLISIGLRSLAGRIERGEESLDPVLASDAVAVVNMKPDTSNKRLN